MSTTLEEQLVAHRVVKVIRPVAEIGDSRAAIRALMNSMEWRGGAGHTCISAKRAMRRPWILLPLTAGAITTASATAIYGLRSKGY